jgi:hypothetical protein
MDGVHVAPGVAQRCEEKRQRVGGPTSSSRQAPTIKGQEFGLKLDGDTDKSRLDLFIVDRENKIVITIENKVKAKLGKAQLKAYYERVAEKVARRPVFKEFLFLYVVVDSKLETYDNDMLSDLGNRWALLDYTWRQPAAERARLHIERNNEAAQMLMAYCRKQTGWESPNERKVSELAGEFIAMRCKS